MHILEQKEKIQKLLYPILTWGLIGFFTVLYISLLFNHNIVTDEAFTMQLLGEDWSGIIRGTANDVHPPLYYLIGKVFQSVFGKSLLVQKIVAIIPMVLTLILGAVKIPRNFGYRAAFLFVLMLTCMPCSMLFALQVRMYSLALFFVTGTALYAYDCYLTAGEKRKLPWICLIFYALGAGYSHYFALVAVVAINGLLLLCLLVKRKGCLDWLVSSVLMCLGYAPWAGILFWQLGNVTTSYWIPPITKEVYLDYYTWAFGLESIPQTTYVFLGLLLVAGILNIREIYKERVAGTLYPQLCMLVPFAVCTIGVGISLATRPIYRDQYIFPSMGVLSLFFAIPFARKCKEKLLLPVVVFLLFVGALQYKENFREEYRNSYVPQTEAFFAENLQENDCIIYNFEVVGFIYKFYFPEHDLVYMEDWDPDNDYHCTYMLDTPSELHFTDGQLEQWGYHKEYKGHFGIEQNEFDIYAIMK